MEHQAFQIGSLRAKADKIYVDDSVQHNRLRFVCLYMVSVVLLVTVSMSSCPLTSCSLHVSVICLAPVGILVATLGLDVTPNFQKILDVSCAMAATNRTLSLHSSMLLKTCTLFLSFQGEKCFIFFLLDNEVAHRESWQIVA